MTDTHGQFRGKRYSTDPDLNAPQATGSTGCVHIGVQGNSDNRAGRSEGGFQAPSCRAEVCQARWLFWKSDANCQMQAPGSKLEHPGPSTGGHRGKSRWEESPRSAR